MSYRHTQFARELWQSTGGNALVLTALALPALIGASGLGMDTIQWTVAQRQLQREADSAALAGAFAKAQGSSASTAANASLKRDNLVSLAATPTIESAPTTGAYAGNASAVRVVLQTTKTLPFSNLFLNRTVILKVSATAASVNNGNYCIISLEKTTATGITLQGNATVDMGCGMATNSRAASAVIAGGSTAIVASQVAAVGGLKASANYASGTVLLPYTVPQADPYSGLPTPTVPSPCNAKLTVQPSTTVNVTNSTGSTCYKGMDIKGTVNFASGIYYIDGGSLSFGSQAVVTGANVTFILTSSTAATNPSSIATLSMNGGATVNLTATTTDTYAGVLVYQDRRAPSGTTNTVNGNSSSKLQGGFYFQAQNLSFSGTSGMVTDCIQLVSRQITFIGNTTIDNTCPTDSGAGAFKGTRVYLVG